MAQSRLTCKHRHVWAASCWPFEAFLCTEHNEYTTQRCEIFTYRPFTPAVTGICNRSKGAEIVWKGHVVLKSSYRLGEIHLLLKLWKCIHTTSENHSETFLIKCKLWSNCGFSLFIFPAVILLLSAQVQILSINCLKRKNYKQQTTTWIHIQHGVNILLLNIPTYQTIKLKLKQKCSMLPCIMYTLDSLGTQSRVMT